MKRTDINAFIAKNQKLTRKELAEKCGISVDAVTQREQKMGIKREWKHPSAKQPVVKSAKELTTEAKLEGKIRADGLSRKEVEKKYKITQDELARTQKALDDALGVMKYQPKVHRIEAPKPNSGGSGTVVALASDFHLDELVPKHKVNGLNEYNPDIAKRRADKFFELVVRFIRVDRGETAIGNLVLWLGGDFFTSSTMHDAPCAYPPVVAAMVAQDTLVSGIQFLLEQEPKLKIHIVGSVGNHSRLSGSSQPVNQATEQELSLEWMMYHAIKQHFASEPRITVQLDASYSTYVKVYDKVIRFQHGHQGWRYNDGMGGVHGPFWKYITQRADKQVKADLSCCGHYHTYTPAARGRSYTVNGSLIGATPYSLSFGFEEPIQAYFLVHSKYGIVGQRPLFVDM